MQILEQVLVDASTMFMPSFGFCIARLPLAIRPSLIIAACVDGEMLDMTYISDARTSVSIQPTLNLAYSSYGVNPCIEEERTQSSESMTHICDYLSCEGARCSRVFYYQLPSFA